MTHRLDPNTLHRLAELIVDAEGPFERAGWQVAELLRHVPWTDPPEYDGSARVAWLESVMSERSPDELARLICRICLPVEYDDGAPAADAVREAVNGLLSMERMTVTLVAGRPVLADIQEGDGRPVYSAPGDLRDRLPRLIRDAAVAEALAQRAEEADSAERGGASALAIIGMGSFLEGLLYALLHERDPQFRDHGVRNDGGHWVSPQRAGLALLLNDAHRRGWVHTDALTFADHVRDFRNFVHLRHQMSTNIEPDGDTVMMCWAPILAVLNDLDAALL